MTAVQYLSRYREAERKAEYLKEHIAFLREQSTSLQRTLDGMPRGSSNRDKVAGIISSIAEWKAVP